MGGLDTVIPSHRMLRATHHIWEYHLEVMGIRLELPGMNFDSAQESNDRPRFVTRARQLNSPKTFCIILLNTETLNGKALK